MSAETQNNAKADSAFGDKKVTQAEVAMFVQRALQPVVQRLIVIQNAVDTLYSYLGEIGVNGTKITQEELIAYVQSKNNQAAQKPKENGTQT